MSRVPPGSPSYTYDELLDIPQAAARAGVSEDEIRRRMATGKLPRLKSVEDLFTLWDVDHSGPDEVTFADYFDRIEVDGWGEPWSCDQHDETELSADGTFAIWTPPDTADYAFTQVRAEWMGEWTTPRYPIEYRFRWGLEEQPDDGESYTVQLTGYSLIAQVLLIGMSMRSQGSTWVNVKDNTFAEVYSADHPLDPPLDFPGFIEERIFIDPDAGVMKLKAWNAAYPEPDDWTVELTGLSLDANYANMRLEPNRSAPQTSQRRVFIDYILVARKVVAFEDRFSRDVEVGWGDGWATVLDSPLDEARVSDRKGIWTPVSGGGDRWDAQHPVGVIDEHEVYGAFPLPPRANMTGSQVHLGVGDVDVAPAVQYGAFLFPATNTIGARCWVDGPDGQYELAGADVPMPADAETLFMRGRYEDGVFMLRVWTDSDREPSEWHISEAEHTPLGGPFSAGGPLRVIFVAGASNGGADMMLDRVSLESVEPEED